MVKKKKRRQKQSGPQHPPLENLLRSGEAGVYGQVCWSIANRGTEPPRSGEVITLEGGEGNGRQTSRAFRLTRKSVENVERCLALRTCGEAVELFADGVEPDPSGASLSDCPHGHREAAFAYMIYGIEPTEPCPNCGEIPTFGNVAMSPDFYSDGPVKGVDGQQHATCPQCGEDSLEIRGEGVAKWGRDIGCLNCEWEMKLAEKSGHSPVLRPDGGSEIQSRSNQPVDGDARNHDANPCGVCLPPASDAAGTHRLQFAGIEQGRVGEVAEGATELPGHQQEGSGN